MSENILQTVQHVVQDVIAPDVRELKVRIAALEKLVEVRFDAVGQRFDAFDQKSEAQFKALLSAISESRAQAELTSTRVLASLSERVAIHESQRH